MIKRLLLLLLSVLLAPWALAAQYAIVYSGGDETVYREFSRGLTPALASHWQIAWEGQASEFNKFTASSVDVVITLGSSAAKQVLSASEGAPVISALLSKSSYESIRRQSPPRKYAPTALFLDQPLSRQLSFIRRLLPEADRLVTVTGDVSSDTVGALKRLANSQNFAFDHETLNDDENIVPILERLMAGRKGVFLALSDNRVFARENIRPLLLTSYRYHYPVVAFSPGFVQAGALAAIYTAPAQFGAELAGWMNRYKTSSGAAGVLPSPQYPSTFSIRINPQVAHSLKLTVPDEKSLMQVMGAETP